MTREEFDKSIKDTKRWRNGALMALDISDEYITSLEATIEAQEIIIKDKSAIMEAMSQPKTCNGCKWLPNEDEYGMTLCSHKYTCVRQESEDYYELKAQYE